MQSGTKMTPELSSRPHVVSGFLRDGAPKRDRRQTKSLTSRTSLCFPLRPLVLALGIAPFPAAFAETVVCDARCIPQTIASILSLAPSGTGTSPDYYDFKSASLTGNVVRLVNGAPVLHGVYGAVNMAGDTDPVTDNRVFIENAMTIFAAYGGMLKNQSLTANPAADLLGENNHVTLNEAGALISSMIGGYVSASYAREARAENNTVTIDAGTVDFASVAGGQVTVSQGNSKAIATGNSITINGGKLKSGIYGGLAEGYCGSCSGFATDNTVTITGGDLSGVYYIVGGAGISDGSDPALTRATGNTVTISGNPIFGNTRLYGGSLTTRSDHFIGNRLNVWNYTGNAPLTLGSVGNFQYYDFVLPDTLAAGGSLIEVKDELWLRNDASTRHSQIERIALGGNQTIAPGDTITLIDASSARSSQVNVPDATHAGVTLTTPANKDKGMETEWALAYANQTLTARLTSLKTSGDLVRPNGYRIDSNDGAVTLIVGGALKVGGTGLTVDNSSGNGATVDIGAFDASASDENIHLLHTTAWNGSTGVRFQTIELGNGHHLNIGAGGDYAVGTYNIHGAATSSGHLNATGSTLNFFIPETMGNGGVLLDLSGDAHITDATANITVEGKSPALQKGERVTLIRYLAQSGKPANTQTTGQGMHGIMLDYEFDLDWRPDALVATLTGIRASPGSQSPLESYLVGNAFATYQGGDFLADQGLLAAKNAAAGDRSQVFAVLGGGKMRHKTGSHVDVKGHTLVTGAATGLRSSAGDATLAAFFEYGKGDYDSEHSFAFGKVKGTGDTSYEGLGLLGRFDFNNATYLEGSLRGGKVKAGYRANFAGQSPQSLGYDAKNSYAGLHLGGGRLWKLNESMTLDSYAKFLWTRQGKDTLHLSTGHDVQFDAVHSQRIKLGARFNHAFTKNLTGFVGAAYDHEFGGKARARAKGLSNVRFDTPEIKGGTGMLELGLTSRPSSSQPIYVDFGVQGYAGKREGVTANVRVSYLF